MNAFDIFWNFGSMVLDVNQDKELEFLNDLEKTIERVSMIHAQLCDIKEEDVFHYISIVSQNHASITSQNHATASL